MVKLPPRGSPTVEAIYRHYEQSSKDWRRPHLGASLIGDENCLRLLWYSFRWTRKPPFEGRLLRLFETGDREEERVKDNLQAIGVRVEAIDPETGEQWRFAFAGGHVGGSADGAVLGVLEAPKTWHLLEVKTMNERRFKKLKKEGIEKSQPGHYAQVQVNMVGLKLKRAFYVVTHKDTDELHVERPKVDKPYAEAMIGKGRGIVFSPSPPVRISEDPAWFECKFCDYFAICHDQHFDQLERNCRTCASSTPMPDGTWRCEHLDKALDIDEQRMGCGDHVFVPGILPWEIVDGCEEERYAVYQKPDGTKIVDEGGKLWPTS